MPHSLRHHSSSSTLSLDSSSAPSSPDLSQSTEDFSPVVPHYESVPLDDGKDFILVIGGAGYIGSHTTLELLEEGYNVIIVDDLSNSFEHVVSRIEMLALDHCRFHGLMMPTLRFHKMSYRSSAMRHLFTRYAACRSHISGVIHFAAFKSVSESIERPLAYYQNNVGGLIELLDIIQSHGIKNFVFSSSATVYGSKANEGKPLREEDLVHFDEVRIDRHGTQSVSLNGSLGLTSPYGRTKFMAEAILADMAKADPTMRITALRYFNPVGCDSSGIICEDPRQQPTNLFPVIASVVKGTKPTLEIFGSDWNTRDGTAVRDFIHVTDLAQGHVAALVAARDQRKRDAFRTYNLGSGRGMTVAEVIASFEKASGSRVPSVITARRAGDVGSCIAATQRAEAELGWKTEKGVDECAKDTWNALTLPEVTSKSAF